MLDRPSPTTPKLIFLTGKGGVGKTTTSSSLALLLSTLLPTPTSESSGNNILLVSTDPAHSVHDALGLPKPEEPEVSKFESNVVPEGCSVYVSELDVRTSPLNELTGESLKKVLDFDTLTENLGISPNLLEGFGVRDLLSDVSDILTSGETGGLFPPGSDELLCVLNLLTSTVPGTSLPFDYIICDTAPSGHTVRMLNGPRFIDGALGKVLKLKGTMNTLVDTIAGFAGGGMKDKGEKTVNDVLNLIDDTQVTIRRFSDAVDKGEVGFVVVGIPTRLSLEESKRVVRDINGIKGEGGDGINLVEHVVVNQILPEGLNNDEGRRERFMLRRKEGQERKVAELKEGIPGDIVVHEIPYVDTEVVGVPGLMYLGDVHFNTPEISQTTMFSPPSTSGTTVSTRFVIFGGKGGVGKTTTSAAAAVKMCRQGHKVAIISTDPAHSLGDALGMDLNGDEGTDVTGMVYDNPGDGEIRAFEIDPEKEVGAFKDLLRGITTPDKVKAQGINIGDLSEVLDTLPPGADEVIALVKVLDILKKGGYTRVVLDTAPTGHTVRMLTFPRYIDGVIEKVIRVADRVKPTAMMVNGNLKESDIADAKSKLVGFQIKMFELDDIIADKDTTEFAVVTIATDLAVKETVRLVSELRDGEVQVGVGNVFVNQLVGEGGGDAFVRNVVKGQERILKEFEEDFENVVKVGLLDEEPKGEYGLMALWGSLRGDEGK